ncbi:MAG: DUF2723 domain-containing protein [candidate division WOR-3 bacterium]
MKTRFWEVLLEIGVALIPFALLLFTASGTVGLVDSGELSCVAWTLGISHPTGYPLWTILGYIWSHIVPVGEPVWRLSAMSAICAGLASWCLFKAGKELGFELGASLSAALAFPFLRLVWATSAQAEVYALGAALVGVFLFSLARWFKGRCHPAPVFYTAGLVLTNHMSGASVVLPGLALMAFLDRRTLRWAWVFLIPLSVYLYLPIRSSHEPFFDWGDPQTLQNILWHITGKQYSVWMFGAGFSGFLSGLRGVTGELWNNLNIGVILPILGVVLAQRHWRLVLLSAVALSFIYLAGYTIPDIGDYFLPLFITICLLSGFALSRLGRFSWTGLLLPALLVFLNFNSLNRRGDTFAQDYARAHIADLEPNALVLCNYWDLVSPTLYLQHVKGERRDITIIDKELLRRSWYIKHIKLKHPALYGCAKDEIEAYARELRKFERGLPYDPELIQSAYINMLRAMLTRYPGPRYTAFAFYEEDERQILEGLKVVPQGLCIRIAERDTAFPFDPTRYTLPTYNRFPRNQRERVLFDTFTRETTLSKEFWEYSGKQTPIRPNK